MIVPPIVVRAIVQLDIELDHRDTTNPGDADHVERRFAVIAFAVYVIFVVGAASHVDVDPITMLLTVPVQPCHDLIYHILDDA